MGDELSRRQAQNGVNFDFEVKFDLEGQGQSPPKTIGILTKVFYTYGPNLVILAWTGDELSRGQTWWRTDGRTQATTIPEGQYWPRVKTTALSTLFYKLFIVFWELLINKCVQVKISKCLFDIAHKTPCAQEVETLKLQLSTYTNFFTGEIQDDACECLMLLIEIMDKGFGLYPTNANINNKGSFSELPFSFVLEKYITCDICTMKSPNFWNH